MENLVKFASEAIEEKDLPKYLIDLLEEANKEKPNPRIWRVEKGYFDENGNYKYKEEHPLNKGIFSELWHPDTYKSGIFKCLGWEFDFSKSWKKYLVNWRYYGWTEQRAPNKTYIREHACHPHDIIQILEFSNDIRKNIIDYKKEYNELKEKYDELLKAVYYHIIENRDDARVKLFEEAKKYAGRE